MSVFNSFRRHINYGQPKMSASLSTIGCRSLGFIMSRTVPFKFPSRISNSSLILSLFYVAITNLVSTTRGLSVPNMTGRNNISVAAPDSALLSELARPLSDDNAKR